ncbi:flagellar basal body rod protein FlgC [Vagococcus carniphilus]|uniref:Flagellar basal-body rod protein FlgC n=1 Tax=Vagococcus carniphilus TaxID=218144 RepID=A0A430B4S4_9ENTE|nr:flagellar basal body rod protein FlgC [Vagococcus carniphilus]MDT2815880.1 flagellar basal body rod protein FlgC [Vagococcus carniphilus]MDT2829609.1 flagellar basal body rod protein FlgC [Vagococcus carniphilus]MDT2833689.1 flagellar basal body rod protein FlgC [Vagococcus carniphilus]MDT2839068.1 flagellar basal body rod protein FlgC [Vagococcus carniphilus]MDT2847642.1 flagellar basal body rod protein FlgC [Vagococcus carniphilus]
MSIFDSFNINTSGLSLERLKLDTISTNIANVNTTRTEEGGPYKRKEVMFQESLKKASATDPTKSAGVKPTQIREDQDTRIIYQPEHPDADENGYLELPNVNLSDEMINMMNTVRTYEANASAFESSKNMMKKALEISKD